MSYPTTHDHQNAEVDRVDAMLSAFDSAAETPAVDTESTPDSECLVQDPDQLPLALDVESRQQISEMTTEIEQRCENTDETRLRLRILAEVCGLSRRHLDVLMLAVATLTTLAVEQGSTMLTTSLTVFKRDKKRALSVVAECPSGRSGTL